MRVVDLTIELGAQLIMMRTIQVVFRTVVD